MIMKHESDFMEGIRKCIYILAGLARQIPSNKYDLVVTYAMVVCVFPLGDPTLLFSRI